MPADEASTVECPADATPPTAPTVVDACGNTITPTPGTAPSPLTCEGDMVYTFTYADCAYNISLYADLPTFDIPDFTMPADEASTVECPADATPPTAPTVVDACGNTITPTPGTAPSRPDERREGNYTSTYADRDGNSHEWTYTYTIVIPDSTIPA